jgi:hypothetical protein
MTGRWRVFNGEEGYDMPPTLLVSIDTEEEFDWSAPVSPRNRSVRHARHLSRLQEVFDATGARPTYLIDHPIATTDLSLDVLAGFHRRGACDIGAHLHPWVNPPLTETICPRNSYLMNLPPSLQRDKLHELTRAIRENLGVAPTSFKAGRYGLDFALAPALAELGYQVDTSVLANCSFKHEGGPDFSAFGTEPFRLGPLLEVPCTAGFNRGAQLEWAAVHRALSGRPWRLLRPIGVLWRLGLLRKIVLTPEGYELPDLIALMRVLVDRNPDAVLNVTLHSPSCDPGHTPYVRNGADLKAFLAALRGTLEFAVRQLGARPMTLSEFAHPQRKELAA